MPTDPLDAYCDWLEALASPVADELGISLTQLFPGERLGSPVARMFGQQGLSVQLRGLFSDPRKRAGLLLSLVALTDYVMEERADPRRWEERRGVLDGLRRAQESLQESHGANLGEDVSAWIEDNQLAYPFRARQWQREAEAWRRMRAQTLGNAEVSRFLRAQTRKTLDELS